MSFRFRLIKHMKTPTKSIKPFRPIKPVIKPVIPRRKFTTKGLITTAAFAAMVCFPEEIISGVVIIFGFTVAWTAVFYYQFVLELKDKKDKAINDKKN
jgi:hypothetical protein